MFYSEPKEISHSRSSSQVQRQITVDDQLVKNICLAHVTAHKDEQKLDVSNGAVPRLVTPSPVPSSPRKSTSEEPGEIKVSKSFKF